MALPIDKGYNVLSDYTKPKRVQYLARIHQEEAELEADHRQSQAEKEAMAVVATKKGKWKSDAIGLASQPEEGPSAGQPLLNPKLLAKVPIFPNGGPWFLYIP